jgi:hypothetical protein
MQKFAGGVLASFLVVLLFNNPLYAQGLIGKRFFPATLVADGPFVSDELDLLKVTQGDFTFAVDNDKK